jgi:hypothetical protein
MWLKHGFLLQMAKWQCRFRVKTNGMDVWGLCSIAIVGYEHIKSASSCTDIPSVIIFWCKSESALSCIDAPSIVAYISATTKKHSHN